MWLGGGEVDLKWRVAVSEFIAQMKPVVGKIVF
jgi:hypothetical protein